jgi:hypothetical protein
VLAHSTSWSSRGDRRCWVPSGRGLRRLLTCTNWKPSSTCALATTPSAACGTCATTWCTGTAGGTGTWAARRRSAASRNTSPSTWRLGACCYRRSSGRRRSRRRTHRHRRSYGAVERLLALKPLELGPDRLKQPVNGRIHAADLVIAVQDVSQPSLAMIRFADSGASARVYRAMTA